MKHPGGDTPIKIARVVTIPLAFVHFKPFLKLLKTKGIDLTLISSPGEYSGVLKRELGLEVTSVNISRDIRPAQDLKTLFRLASLYRRVGYDIIHSSTPKAGLLSALAGLLSPGSVRLHTFTGQRWAHLKGASRWLFKFFDRLIIKLNTQCYADSFSQVEFLLKEKVCKPGEVLCLHKGSYGGIDTSRFNNDLLPEARQELLSQLGLPGDSILLLFLGRLTHDKGVDELVAAFRDARALNPRLKLILVGPFERDLDSLRPETLSEIESNPGIHSLGFKPDPEKYLSACDIFCMPSYREGFGTVVLEAAACALPTVGTCIPGLVDSIEDGVTGLLVTLGNTEELSGAIVRLAGDESERRKMGQAAKQRAQRDFDSKIVSEAQWSEYLRLLKEVKKPRV